MSVIAKATNGANFAVVLPAHEHFICGLVAGENMAMLDAVYVKNDGTVWRANGTAATAPAKVRGFASRDYLAGQVMTYQFNLRATYCDPGTLTPGADVFLSATAGQLDTATTTGGTTPIGYAVSDTDIYLART